MGDLRNGLTIGQDTEWSCTKCTNDHDFSMPVQRWEAKDFQLDLSDPQIGGAPGLYVCEIHMTDKVGNRLIENLMSKYGPTWWRNNPKDINGFVFNVFTFRLPETLPFCSTIEMPAPCCLIDLAESVGPTYPDDWSTHHANATIYYKGLTYHLNSPAVSLPAGWNFAPGSNRYIVVPCDLKSGDGVLTVTGGDIDAGINAGTYLLDVKPCENILRKCYIAVPDVLYTTADYFYLDGVGASFIGPIFPQSPSVIPYVSDPSQHVFDPVTNMWKVPVNCDLKDHTLIYGRSGPLGIERMADVFDDVGSYVGPTVQVPVNCFRLEFVLGIDQFCDVTTIFSEPMECPLCEKTLMISSDYKGGEDVLGNVYDLDSFPDVVNFPDDGDLREFKNNLRIPAVLRNLPSKITVTRNDNCFTYKSELAEQFRIQGTKAYPPYFAKMVENVMAGSKFLIDGVEYQLTSDSVFTVLSEKGFSALRLDTIITKCPNTVVFDCTA